MYSVVRSMIAYWGHLMGTYDSRLWLATACPVDTAFVDRNVDDVC
jgi:hypothetical protein